MKHGRSNSTYLSGAGEEVSTALSNTTSEELGGFWSSGIRAVKVTACGTFARSVIVTRTLLSDVAVGVKGAPSSVIEYEAKVAFPYS
jgi:hypothetical protein